MKKKLGTCYGIGVGAGNSNHLTVEAVRLLKKSSVVVALHTANKKKSRAEKIASPVLTKKNKIIHFPLVMSPRHPSHLDVYKPLMPTIVDYLNRGRDVAILCEGDPMFYGSFQYIVTLLDGRYPLRAIAGVSSPSLAAATAVMSLGKGTESLGIIPATAKQEKIKKILSIHNQIVIIKIGRHLAAIKKLLTNMKLLQQSHLFIEVGNEDEKIIPLMNYKKKYAPYFSLLIIKK